ncbi:magnesium transporter CorA [Herbaspirillum sp. HC18]|nr:magnesium transporter CorA [Herbaspirillum sp. HC18]
MNMPAFLYGSEQSGLVWGYIFSPDAAARPVDSDDAVRWLQSEREPGNSGFLWLHFNLSNAASEKWMRRHAVVPEEFFEALHEGSRSTRIELVEGKLLAVVNDVLHDFAFEPSDIATLWLSVSERVVVSARIKPLQSIESLRQSVQRGDTIRSTVELLVHLLRDQAEVLVRIVRKTVAQVDDIEDSLLADRPNHTRAKLGTLRRVLVRLQRLLAPEPAALFRLLQRPPAWIAETDLQELRQSTEEFSVVLNDMVSLQERIKLLQEEIAARVDEENGRSLYLLTTMTVLALPVNMVAGLFGMNVGGIPLASDQTGFWTIVAFTATVTVIAAWMLLMRQKK